jgi:alpha 1,3-mannosyltransferase
MKKKVTKKRKQPARRKRAPKRKVSKMATATETTPPPAHAKAVKKEEETEKERADKELEERLKREGPSPLLVKPAETEPERLRERGFPVMDTSTAGLPGGGPAHQYGMSAGGPTPKEEDVEKALDEQSKVLEKERSEKEKRDKEEKERQDKERAASKKGESKKTA